MKTPHYSEHFNLVSLIRERGSTVDVVTILEVWLSYRLYVCLGHAFVTFVVVDR